MSVYDSVAEQLEEYICKICGFSTVLTLAAYIDSKYPEEVPIRDIV